MLQACEGKWRFQVIGEDEREDESDSSVPLAFQPFGANSFMIVQCLGQKHSTG